jgi:hypothetical protein
MVPKHEPSFGSSNQPGAPPADMNAGREVNNPAQAGSAPNAEQGSGQGVTVAAKDVTGKAQEKAGELADQARQQASSRLESGKELLVETLQTVAQAVRQTSQELRKQDQATVAGYAEGAAERVERFSSYLHNRDVGQLVDETERFTRQRPALVLGGASLVGLLAARFLKASSQREEAKQRYYQSLHATGTTHTQYPQSSPPPFEPHALDRAPAYQSTTYQPTAPSPTPVPLSSTPTPRPAQDGARQDDRTRETADGQTDRQSSSMPPATPESSA